jgi:Viral BACON domain
MGIDTKRCQHCQKVLRADAPRCSLCGYVFSPEVPDKRNGGTTNGSRRTVTLTMPSNPPASPHRAGHYSGLHPEDQPFQSSFMPVQRARTITRSLVDQEVVLPTFVAAPAPPPKAPDTEGLPKRRVAVPTPLPLPMPQRSVNSPLGSSPASPQRQFVSPPVTPAPLTNQWFTEPVPAVLPLPRKQQKQSRVVPVLLFASCLLFLLATSVLAFLLLDKRPAATTQAVTHVSHAAPLLPAIAITPSALSFSAIQGTNPAPQPFTISNKGNAPLNWAAAEDANGLAFAPVSPKQGTVAPGKTATLTVTPDVTRAPAGFINALITISDTHKGIPVGHQQVQVAITILNQAVINVSSTTMTFNLNSTTSNSTQSLVITNTGSAPLNWTLVQSSQPLPSWLSLDVTGGTLSPGESKFVNVTCDSTGLSAGNYKTTLMVSDTDADTPVVPQDVQVILAVS